MHMQASAKSPPPLTCTIIEFINSSATGDLLPVTHSVAIKPANPITLSNMPTVRYTRDVDFSGAAEVSCSLRRSFTSSSIVTLKHALNNSSLSSSGVDVPLSHFEIAYLETESFSASCS